MHHGPTLFPRFWFVVELMGLNWTVAQIAAAVMGTIGAIAAIYALYEWWMTSEHRRLTRLCNYILAEEYEFMSELGDREYDQPQDVSHAPGGERGSGGVETTRRMRGE
jgi:hypothetical protein